MIVPADIEYLIAQSLPKAVPSPVPKDLAAPCVVVWRTGGTRTNLIDTHTVSIDVYEEDYGTATELTGDVLGRVQALYGEVVEGVQFGAVDVLTLPYANPDPNNPSLARLTFSVSVVSKAVIKE